MSTGKTLLDGIPHHPAFDDGLRALERQDYAGALGYFHVAEQQADDQDPLLTRYRSFLGLAMVLSGDPSGVELCRHAAYFETEDPRIFLNLARVERLVGDRRRLVEALRAGLRIAPEDPGLLALRDEIGWRRPPPVRWLHRDHPLNRWLGRCSYRWRHRREALPVV